MSSGIHRSHCTLLALLLNLITICYHVEVSLIRIRYCIMGYGQIICRENKIWALWFSLFLGCWNHVFIVMSRIRSISGPYVRCTHEQSPLKIEGFLFRVLFGLVQVLVFSQIYNFIMLHDMPITHFFHNFSIYLTIPM